MWFCSVTVLVGLTEAFNILLFLLAVSRFTIYFWPTTEKVVKILQTNGHKRVHYLYLAFVIKTFFFFLAIIYIGARKKKLWYLEPAVVVS